jgi:hypothetical protein
MVNERSQARPGIALRTNSGVTRLQTTSSRATRSTGARGGVRTHTPLRVGGLSRPGAVRPVLWIPFAQLRCGLMVRRVRLVGRVSDRAGESRAGSVQEIAAFGKEHTGVPNPWQR